jgi:hypothetical protein
LQDYQLLFQHYPLPTGQKPKNYAEAREKKKEEKAKKEANAAKRAQKVEAVVDKL